MKKEKYEHPALEDIDFKICEADTVGDEGFATGLKPDGNGDETPKAV